MGVLLSFFVGWAVGAKAGPKGYQEVVDAARTVRQSEEFTALVDISRRHLSTALHELSRMVSTSPDAEPEDLLTRVRRMTGSRSV